MLNSMLLYRGIDFLSFAIVGIPTLIILLWVFRTKSLGKKIAVCVFSLYLAAVAVVVGVPSIDHFDFHPTFTLVPFVGLREGFVERVLNVILFLPMGFLLPVIWERFRSAKNTILAGFLISLSIECLQMFTFRVTDINDLITNTLGTALGFLLLRFIARKVRVYIQEKPLYPREMEAVAATNATLLFLVCPSLEEAFFKTFVK